MTESRRGTTLGSAAALGAVAGLLNILAGVVRSKITAVVLGPSGIGKTAEIMQLATIANLPATMVGGPTLLSTLAEATRDGDDARATRVMRTATTVVLLTSAAGALVATVAGLWLLPAPWGRAAWPLTALGGLALMGSALLGVPVQLLTARAELRRLTLLRIVVALLGTVLVIGATIAFDLTGLFVGMAVGAVAAPFMALAFVPGAKSGCRPTTTLDRAFVRRAAELGLTSLLSGLAAQAGLFAYRWALEAHGGPTLNGQFQAAWTIGTIYFALVLDGMGTYVFPRYAAARDSAELEQEVDAAARFVLRVAPPAVALAIAFRAPVVRILYSHRFDDAVDLLGLLMVGDLAKAVAWVQGGPLLYRHRLRAFLLSEVAGAITHVAGALVLVPRLGLRGAGYSTVVANLGYALLGAFVTSASCGIRVRFGRLMLTIFATASAYALMVACARFEFTRWIVLLLAAIWWARAGAYRILQERLARWRSHS